MTNHRLARGGGRDGLRRLRSLTVLGCLVTIVVFLALETAITVLEAAVVFLGWNWVVSPLFHVGAMTNFWLVVGLVYLVNFLLAALRSAFSSPK